MVGIGLVAAVAVLASHGEGTREEKFRGVLLAEASQSELTQLDVRAASIEISRLRALKPSLFEPGIALGVGLGLVAVGTAGFVFGLSAFSTFWGLLGVGGGAFIFVGGVVTVAIATIALIANTIRRNVLEDRIRKLQKDQELLPPSDPVTSSPASPNAPLVLSRF